jgi:two-component system sensor histidine kinase YesM
MRSWSSIQWLTDRPLVLKMIGINFILVALPLTIASYMTFDNYSKSIQDNVGTYQADLVRELTTNIDTFMNELNLLSMGPYQNPEILKFLNHNPNASLSFEERTMLEDFYKRIFINGRVDLIGLGLYGTNGSSYLLKPASVAIYGDEEWQDEDWSRNAPDAGQGVFIGPHEIRSVSGSRFQAFSIIRKIRSLETGKDLAYFVLDVDLEEFRNSINHLSNMTYQNVTIVDETANVVYQKGELPLRLEETTRYRGMGTESVKWQGQSELLTYYTSPITGWTTFQTVPVSFLLKDTIDVRNKIILIGIGCLALAVLLSAWISFRVTNPISNLRNLMKRVERGDLKVSAPIRSRDEIGQLSHTFNIMVSRLSDLGYKLYESEIREKNSQIAALQSQVNPHFLYNTLGSISMYAEIQGNKEVVQMTHNLSKLLRYSIGSDHAEVSLKQELEHVKGYMAIQQIRYEERLKFVVRVEERLFNCQVIRLILQPIVENAIIHGFDQGNGNGTIELSVENAKDNIQITIEDDGIGISRTKLSHLNNKLIDASLPDGPGGIGLVNVHRRISLRYGAPFGLTIEHSISGGTRIIILLPIIS